jgi:hypothetical protein
MLRRINLVILAALLVLALAPAVMAQFAPHGSLDPTIASNGFPTSVTDINGVSVDLPNPPYGDGINPPTLIYDPVIPNNSLSAASGFGAEAFFYLAESTMTLPNGGRALLVLGIEAAYGAGDPDPTSPPDQFLFARVRVRFDATAAGTYTVTHPWGVETLVVTPADVGSRFSYTNDWGGFAPIPSANPLLPLVPSSFERILYSPRQWRFLLADAKVVQTPGDENLIVGDGVTPTTVTGGLNRVNSFTITGPANAFGTTNTATTDLFTVSGHIAGAAIPTTTGTVTPPPQPATDTVTITRARLRGAQVEVRATSSNGFPMTAELFAGGVGGTLVGSGNLGTNGRGNISFTGATPDTVRVHSTSTNPNILGGAAVAPITN